MHAADHDYITTQSNTLIKSVTTTHSENEKKIGKITSETNVGNSTKLDNILL